MKRKEGNVYLTTHSAHFIYGYMVKEHPEKRGNSLPPLYVLLFSISSKFFMYHPTDRIAHTTTFVMQK